MSKWPLQQSAMNSKHSDWASGKTTVNHSSAQMVDVMMAGALPHTQADVPTGGLTQNTRNKTHPTLPRWETAQNIRSAKGVPNLFIKSN